MPKAGWVTGKRKRTSVGQKFVRNIRRRNARLRARNWRSAGMLGVETKYVKRYLNDATISLGVTGAELPPAANKSLCMVSIGDTEYNRNGKQFVVKDLEVRGYVTKANLADQADPPAAVLVRVMIIQDKQTNAAQYNSEDVYEETLGEDVLCTRNELHRKRFNVLYDRLLKLEANAFSADGANTVATGFKHASFYFKKTLNMKVNCVSTTDDISSVEDNSVHIMAVCNSASTKMNYQSVMHFIG